MQGEGGHVYTWSKQARPETASLSQPDVCHSLPVTAVVWHAVMCDVCDPPACLPTEAYDILHVLGGLSNDEIATVFAEWNSGELQVRQTDR